MREDFIVVHLQEPCSFCREYMSGGMRCVAAFQFKSRALHACVQTVYAAHCSGPPLRCTMQLLAPLPPLPSSCRVQFSAFVSLLASMLTPGCLRRYYHPAPPQKVVIKSERTFDGISLDKPGLDANRTGQFVLPSVFFRLRH